MTGNLKGLSEDANLARARSRAALGNIPPPSQLVADLHSIPFNVGEEVYDTVTGAGGIIEHLGVENVDPSSAVAQD